MRTLKLKLTIPLQIIALVLLVPVILFGCSPSDSYSERLIRDTLNLCKLGSETTDLSESNKEEAGRQYVEISKKDHSRGTEYILMRQDGDELSFLRFDEIFGYYRPDCEILRSFELKDEESIVNEFSILSDKLQAKVNLTPDVFDMSTPRIRYKDNINDITYVTRPYRSLSKELPRTIQRYIKEDARQFANHPFFGIRVFRKYKSLNEPFVRSATEAAERADMGAAYRLLEGYLGSQDNELKAFSLQLLKKYPQIKPAALNTFSIQSLKETLLDHGDKAKAIEQARLEMYRSIATEREYQQARENFEKVFP